MSPQSAPLMPDTAPMFETFRVVHAELRESRPRTEKDGKTRKRPRQWQRIGSGELRGEIDSPHFRERSAASGRTHDDGDPSQLGVESRAVPDRPPVVEEDLQGSPHGHPADDVQALVDDLRRQASPDGQHELTEGDTHE